MQLLILKATCVPGRREKYVWFVALLAGNMVAYACRTTMPLVSPVVAKDLSWSKTEAGTVLSSFFWGYALTQVRKAFGDATATNNLTCQDTVC